MSITITITDPTPEQLRKLVSALNDTDTQTNVGVEVPADLGKPRPTTRKGMPKPERQAMSIETDVMSPEDAEMAREMAADIEQAEPEPTGAQQVVDAGTGQPVGRAAAEVTLTMDEVRANATRLAQANSTQLKAILGEFGAAKLSEVSPDMLPDFAAKVLAALG